MIAKSVTELKSKEPNKRTFEVVFERPVTIEELKTFARESNLPRLGDKHTESNLIMFSMEAETVHSDDNSIVKWELTYKYR